MLYIMKVRSFQEQPLLLASHPGDKSWHLQSTECRRGTLLVHVVRGYRCLSNIAQYFHPLGEVAPFVHVETL